MLASKLGEIIRYICVTSKGLEKILCKISTKNNSVVFGFIIGRTVVAIVNEILVKRGRINCD